MNGWRLLASWDSCGALMNKLSQMVRAFSGAMGFSALPKAQRQITFYSEGKSYWPHLHSFLMAALTHTELSVCYVSSAENDPGLALQHPRLNTFFIGLGFVRNYWFQTLDTDILVMTMPDLHQYQIKRSRHPVHYVYVQHSLVSLHMVYRPGAFDHYDTLCCAGPHHVQEMKALEQQRQSSPKNILKTGYPVLEHLAAQSKGLAAEGKKNLNRLGQTVLIAPSWGREGVIESGLALRLIDELLKLNFHVILRPHPQTLKFAPRSMTAILNRYQTDANFTFEDCISSQESLHLADLMISDWSGAALEYAFALDKPVLFCDVPRKINNPDYLNLGLEPLEVAIRQRIGEIWDGVGPIEPCVRACLQRASTDLHRIAQENVFTAIDTAHVFSTFLIERCH